jgi:hypothetical protein
MSTDRAFNPSWSPTPGFALLTLSSSPVEKKYSEKDRKEIEIIERKMHVRLAEIQVMLESKKNSKKRTKDLEKERQEIENKYKIK